MATTHQLPTTTGTTVLVLGEGDTCEHPTSSSRKLHGPSLLRITTHTDGTDVQEVPRYPEHLVCAWCCEDPDLANDDATVYVQVPERSDGLYPACGYHAAVAEPTWTVHS